MSAADLVVTRRGARFRGRRFACAVGRGGIGAKAGEGDGVSPAGRWRLMRGYWRADRLARPAGPTPLSPIGPQDRWSDDPADPAYNHLRHYAPGFSAERMARGDPLYDIVLVTDFNWPDAIQGRGSAIFVHVWRGPRKQTEGCVAFARSDLLWILARWTARSRLVLQP